MWKRDSTTGLWINFDNVLSVGTTTTRKEHFVQFRMVNGFSGSFGSAYASEEEAQAAAGELVQELQGK
jgi:hypothetical protein